MGTSCDGPIEQDRTLSHNSTTSHFSMDTGDCVSEGRKVRQSESGYIPRRQPFSVVLINQTNPVWLLGLEPRWIEYIFLVGCSSLSDLSDKITANQSDITLYNTLVNYLGRSTFKFTIPPTNTLHLISGDVQFLNDQAITLRQEKGIFITDKHRHFRKIPPSPLNLARLHHHDVGGPTNFEILWSYHNLSCKFIPSKLKRNISDFMSHSLGPTSETTTALYSPASKLLSVHHIDSLIQYNTRFTTSRIGYRVLSTDELKKMFGFSEFNQRITVLRTSFPVLPLQILHSLLDPTSPSQHYEGSSQLNTPFSHDVSDDTTAIYIKSLGILMPNTWKTAPQSVVGVAKADDALVNTHMWDARISAIWNTFTPRRLSLLRAVVLKFAIKSLYKEFCTFMKIKHGVKWTTYIKGHKGFRDFGGEEGDFGKDVVAGRSVLYNYCGSSYQGWDKGSSLFFLRWGQSSHLARDGIKPYLYALPPNNQRRARAPNRETKDSIAEKLIKYITKGYLVVDSPSNIKNYIDYFTVMKGLTDVRVVFNGTSCGLNAATWSSNFWLPQSSSMTRLLSFGYKAVDIDLGEMFLNFPLHHSVQDLCGVDLTPFKEQLFTQYPLLRKQHHDTRLAARWTRLCFGWRQSPELSETYYYLAEEFIRGERMALDNPLRWDEIKLNLIGTADFDPSLPNVYKWDNVSKRISGDLIAFVDDLRAIGHSLEHAWSIARWVASRLEHLGAQDAPRKRRIDNGPWAGGVYNTDNMKISKTITQEKWTKGKTYLLWLQKILDVDPEATVNYKELERIRGYFCHLAMVYEIFFHT